MQNSATLSVIDEMDKWTYRLNKLHSDSSLSSTFSSISTSSSNELKPDLNIKLNRSSIEDLENEIDDMFSKSLTSSSISSLLSTKFNNCQRPSIKELESELENVFTDSLTSTDSTSSRHLNQFNNSDVVKIENKKKSNANSTTKDRIKWLFSKINQTFIKIDYETLVILHYFLLYSFLFSLLTFIANLIIDENYKFRE